MASNPRVLNTDVVITWDGVQTFVPKGTIVDVPAGSSLEAAYGLGNLVTISGSETTGDDPGETEPQGDAGGGSDTSLCSPSSE